MQKQGDEVEQEVTWEDQQRIVSFSQKNGRIHELTDEINALEVCAFFCLCLTSLAFRAA